jgi:hypothetical protein
MNTGSSTSLKLWIKIKRLYDIVVNYFLLIYNLSENNFLISPRQNA